MNKANSGSGASSIMVIITIVCLTVFGVLALVSVRSENRLSDKTMDAITARYDADVEAQKILAQVDEALYQSSDTETLRQQLAAIPGVTLSDDGTVIEFRTEISPDLYLVVRLDQLYPGAATNRYRVLSYRQINTKEWNPDTGENLYSGN